MRKSLWIVLMTFILLISVMISQVVIQAYGFEQDDKEDIQINTYQQTMMGYSYDIYSYEVLYLHLTTLDQDALDLAFADELMNNEIQSLTVSEAIEVIDQIKTNILETIEIDYTPRRYGMMGGGMMRIGDDRYASCGYLYSRETYEWIYVHSTIEQRENLDYEFAEAIMQIDMSNLTAQEITDQVSDIKQIMVDTNINPIQTNP